MRFLIIHDRQEVSDEICEVISDIFGNSAITDRAKDVFEARDKLAASFYDLAIVDLTLHYRWGTGEPTLDAAETLLAEVFDLGLVRAPADILGISITPEVLAFVRSSIGEHLMACLHEDAGDRWKTDLAAKLRYLAASKRHRQLVTNSSHDYDLLIVTALDKEMKPYQELFELRDCDEFERARVFEFRCVDGVLRRGVIFSIGAAGQAPCASATQALLCHFRPKLALMTGFCGGKGERVAFGDAIAFRSVAGWDMGKWEEIDSPAGKTTVFRPRPGALSIPISQANDIVRDLKGSYAADSDTRGAVLKASNDRITSWKFEVAAAGSGSAVVTSTEKLNQITDHDEDIWAVDMESHGFYFACLNTPVKKPDFLCIKAVADHCNGEKNSVYHAGCSLISASIAKLIVTKKYDFK